MRRNSTKEKRIGRINVNFRPYEIDLKEIDSLSTNEFRGNQAETLRSLVREALVRRRLVREGKDATMSIVKASQAQVIDSRLQPLTTQIDKLIEQVRGLSESNEKLTKNITISSQSVASDVTTIYDKLSIHTEATPQNELIREINTRLSEFLKTTESSAANSSTALKNIIAIRSLFYVFLIAYQPGRIKDANNLTKKQWFYFVRDTQKKLNNLSVEEYSKLDVSGQHKFIEEYTGQLFMVMENLLQSEI